MSFFTTTELAFGLDISDRCLRLVQLAKKMKKIRLQLYNEVKLPPDCLVEGEIKQPKVFLEALNRLIKTKRGRGKLSDEVVSVLPESKTFMKLIEIPLVPEEKIGDKIKEILPQYVPINIEEIYLDWQIVKKTETEQTLLVGASPKNIIDAYVNILSQANLIPTVLEIEAAAIARLLIEQNNDQKPQIIIDIGANRTGLFLYDQETIKFTVSLPISGNKITQLIMETLDLDFEKAEQAKIVCGLDKNKCHGALLEIFSDTINDLQQEIKRAINFYYSNFSKNQKVEKIVLGGGGANFINIAQVIQEKLNIPTTISNPWQNIQNPHPNYFNPQKSQSFITAIGLAIRGLTPQTFLWSLLISSRQTKKES